MKERGDLRTAPALSPNWKTVEHTRIPFEDAVRNGLVLARGIFSNVHTERVVRNDTNGFRVHLPLSQEELAAREMLVGYLGEQGHTGPDVASVLGLTPEILEKSGWGKRDWLEEAQERARKFERNREVIKAEGSVAVKRDLDKEKKAIINANVLDVVSDEFGVPVEDITGPKRFRELVLPRFAGSSIFVIDGGKTLVATGEIMGGRDHSTIGHHLERADILRGENEDFSALYDKSRSRLYAIAFAVMPSNISVTVFPA